MTSAEGSLKRWRTPDHPMPMGVKPERTTVHAWLRRTFGSAKLYKCSHRPCTKPGSDWALDHGRPGLLHGKLSLDGSDYRPLCRTHHARLDAWAVRERVIDLLRSDVELLAPELRKGFDQVAKWAQSGWYEYRR